MKVGGVGGRGVCITPGLVQVLSLGLSRVKYEKEGQSWSLHVLLHQLAIYYTVILKLQCASESPWGLLKYRLLGSIPRVSNSVGLDWGQKICISNKIPHDGRLLL